MRLREPKARTRELIITFRDLTTKAWRPTAGTSP